MPPHSNVDILSTLAISGSDRRPFGTGSSTLSVPGLPKKVMLALTLVTDPTCVKKFTIQNYRYDATRKILIRLFRLAHDFAFVKKS